VPVCTYQCVDCGEVLEKLHPVGQVPARCGLQCRRKTAGPFGKGALNRVPDAPRLAMGAASPPPSSGPTASTESVRRQALERMGGAMTERDLDAARDRGLTVYRRASGGLWERDGGDPALPPTVRRP
jgi:hypothetical protein